MGCSTDCATRAYLSFFFGFSGLCLRLPVLVYPCGASPGGAGFLFPLGVPGGKEQPFLRLPQCLPEPRISSRNRGRWQQYVCQHEHVPVILFSFLCAAGQRLELRLPGPEPSVLPIRRSRNKGASHHSMICGHGGSRTLRQLFLRQPALPVCLRAPYIIDVPRVFPFPLHASHVTSSSSSFTTFPVPLHGLHFFHRDTNHAI